MNDICDRAALVEQEQRERAIEEARRPKQQPDRVLDGDVIICACCGVPIPLARLEIEPCTTVCVECKTLMEKRSGRMA